MDERLTTAAGLVEGETLDLVFEKPNHGVIGPKLRSFGLDGTRRIGPRVRGFRPGKNLKRSVSYFGRIVVRAHIPPREISRPLQEVFSRKELRARTYERGLNAARRLKWTQALWQMVDFPRQVVHL